MAQRHPKFIQITTGQWQAANTKLMQNTLFALGEDGEVYKFLVNEGWVKVEGKPQGYRPYQTPQSNRSQEPPEMDPSNSTDDFGGKW